MTETQLKNRVRIITVTATCFLFILLLIAVGQFITILQYNSRIGELKRRSEKLSEEAVTIEDEIAKRKTEQYVEQYAREMLGMRKEGEKEIT